jgi:hypothetical protein
MPPRFVDANEGYRSTAMSATAGSATPGAGDRR